MSQLQEYVDSQVATISPFKIKSQELLEQAKAKEVTDDATANGLREIPGVEIREEKSF